MYKRQITNAAVSVVISNNSGAYALKRAEDRGIPAVCISPKCYDSREEFHKALLAELQKNQIDLVVLAGYLVAVPPMIVEAYPNRIINIHPSLIPSFCGTGFYGLRVHEGVLNRGVKITGATVHFVDTGTDTGPIILQKAVEVQQGDTPEVLQRLSLIHIYIITMVAVSIGATIATYVGQNRGAGRMDRVRAGVKYSWIMLLIWAVIEMVVMYFGGRYFTYLFIDPSETAVVEVSVTYFRTVFWAYPFLCTIFLFRNALQGMGYGLVPMLGGIFELVARTAIVLLVAGKDVYKRQL